MEHSGLFNTQRDQRSAFCRQLRWFPRLCCFKAEALEDLDVLPSASLSDCVDVALASDGAHGAQAKKRNYIVEMAEEGFIVKLRSDPSVVLGVLHPWWKPGDMKKFTRVHAWKATCSQNHTSSCCKLLQEKGRTMSEMVSLLCDWLLEGRRVDEPQASASCKVHKSLGKDIF